MYCAVCGYETPFASPAPQICPACRLTPMQYGQAPSGFGFEDNRIIRRNIAVPPYQEHHIGTYHSEHRFNYFTQPEYREFIRTKTTYVGKFTNILVPDAKCFAWLSPYTGNKHNRTHFTQMVLATVGRAQLIANGGRFPRLIEPFVGSGQIFLHARRWSPGLNLGMQWFHELIAGDLNPYVIGAYEQFNTGAMGNYLEFAFELDTSHYDRYTEVVQQLNTHGWLHATSLNAADRRWAAQRYIWLVNRCLRGAPLNAAGGLTATRNPKADIDKVGASEQQRLAAVGEVLGQLHATFYCQDFLQTTAFAQPGDIVVMDCPFPKFANTVPAVVPARPETFDSVSAHTYGTGEDGLALQSQIVDEAQRLVAQGTTVVICNFANPGLVLAYRNLLGGIAEKYKRHYVYTYRSPSTESEAYQLTILPGHGVNLDGAILQIRSLWRSAGGDDGFLGHQQDFFDNFGNREDTEDSDETFDDADDILDDDYDPSHV